MRAFQRLHSPKLTTSARVETGGVISGTALIRPDLPELKIWPYFWQQSEYVMGGGETNYMFLALAAAHESKTAK